MKENINMSDPVMKTKTEAFARLLNIMEDLRTGCPWDREQTFESLRHLTIEEVYELSDAILEKDMDGIKKELGDLMLHLVFYAKIGSEKNSFDIKDVLDGIAEKLIYRHPHIYANVEVTGAEEVKNNWEKLKLKIPVLGPTLRVVSVTRFCRILGTMLANGVPILQALEIARDATGSEVLGRNVDHAAEAVASGPRAERA